MMTDLMGRSCVLMHLTISNQMGTNDELPTRLETSQNLCQNGWDSYSFAIYKLVLEPSGY